MLSVDLDDPTPMYVQIARGIKSAIARGAVAVGQRLPSVRQLAGDLAVNLNTVARAYRQLEEEGLLRVRQGRGARVVSDHVHGTPTNALFELERTLGQAFAQARLGGLTRGQIEAASCRGLDVLDGHREQER